MVGELRDEALIPALAKMIESFGESENAYRKVLSAVEMLLQLDKETVSVGGPANA